MHTCTTTYNLLEVFFFNHPFKCEGLVYIYIYIYVMMKPHFKDFYSTLKLIYRTCSNYPNILIARTARLLILFPSHFVEYAEFLVSYTFYLTERPRPASRCNVNLLNYGRVQLHCSY